MPFVNRVFRKVRVDENRSRQLGDLLGVGIRSPMILTKRESKICRYDKENYGRPR